MGDVPGAEGDTAPAVPPLKGYHPMGAELELEQGPSDPDMARGEAGPGSMQETGPETELQTST